MSYSLALMCMVGVLQTTGASPVAFTTLARGQQSAIDDAREVVVRDAAGWKKLWTEHAPEQPVPAVDFSRSSVVGVFLGTRPTGGHAVEITAIERDADAAVVVYRETKPGPDAIVTQVLTSPFHLVRVDGLPKQVRFRRAN
jgi:PrcB C-terminal